MKTLRIKFRHNTAVNMIPPPESTGRVRTKSVKVRKGTVVQVSTFRPYVEDVIEKCDIVFADGSEVFGVEYASFQFVDSEEETPEED